MNKDNAGQIIYNEDEIFNELLSTSNHFKYIVKSDKNFIEINKLLGFEAIENYKSVLDVNAFDNKKQIEWFMPDFYKQLNIAEYILDLCSNNEELKRCGEELIMYQERNLFNLLRYLLYLKDTMEEHNIIWGVGRGSSVSSYILYKLNIHKINSIKYNLDINEFLR